MIEIGKIQKLEVLRIVSIGAYLNSKEDKSDDDILLPKKQIPEDIEIGDEIEVFVYRDSSDRLIATIRRPKIILGEITSLKVVQMTRIGAFLDWGLEKDLLLPFKEQKGKVVEGKEYVVTVYVDKSDRLCATMDIYNLLSSESPYKKDDKVSGVIYSINRDIGAFVAVDLKYHGLILRKEFYGNYNIGDKVEARVVDIKEDGKLELSLREKAYMQMDTDSEIIYKKLQNQGGSLPFYDKSTPEAIKKEFNMSKAAFKRAVGRLLKQGKIKISGNGIELQ